MLLLCPSVRWLYEGTKRPRLLLTHLPLQILHHLHPFCRFSLITFMSFLWRTVLKVRPYQHKTGDVILKHHEHMNKLLPSGQCFMSPAMCLSDDGLRCHPHLEF